MISDEEKEKVRLATDMLSLISESCELRRRGATYWACCPFHHEKSPSFSVNPDTGFWKCFGCGLGGDVFSFVMNREHIDFTEAIRYLAERAHIELKETDRFDAQAPKKKRIFEVLEYAQKLYANQLLRVNNEECQKARVYLKSRGFSSEVCQRWNIGYAPNRFNLLNHLKTAGFTVQEAQSANLLQGMRDRFFARIMFPIEDEHGRCVGFGARVLDDTKPKYLNTSETLVFHKSKLLFAFNRAKERIVSTSTAIVVEGYTDVIALHEEGYTNVVATLGTSLTIEHIKQLARFAKTIVFMFDGDAAGKKAADRALKFILATPADLRCVVLPNNLDPADFVSAHGKAALQVQVDRSISLLDFVFQTRLEQFDLEIPGQLSQAFDELASLLSIFKESILLEQVSMKLANALNISVSQAREKIIHAQLPRELNEYKQETRVKSAQSESHSLSTANKQSDFIQRVPSHKDDLKQIRFEQELLNICCYHPELVGILSKKLALIDWQNPVNKTISEIIISLPQPLTSSDIVQACLAFPESQEIFAPSYLNEMQLGEVEQKLEFLFLSIELYTLQRNLRKNRQRMAENISSDEYQKCLAQTQEIAQKIFEITQKLSKI